jgi:hypothetical protein
VTLRGAAGAATAAALMAGMTLAGCSSTSGGAPSSTPAPPSSTAASSVAPTSTAPSLPATTAPVSTSAAPSTSTPAPPHTTSAPPSAPPTAAPRSTCTSLLIRVLRGSGVAGREFAALQFTNTGSTSCTLHGYPTVTLLLKGRTIGSPSQPADAAASSRRLAPGDTAESRLDDYVMNCQAPLSDSVRVVAPTSSVTLTRPDIQLRACLLRVEPLGAPE